MPASKRDVLVTVGIGLAVGLFSGLFGVGGGVLAVPAMVGLLSIRQHQAHGTSLAAIVVTSAVSGLVYALRGDIDWRLTAGLLVGTVIGVSIGARLMAKIPAQTLRKLFAVALLLTGLRMLVG